MTPETGKNVARARIEIEASPRACWDAWTRPETLAAWYPDRVDGPLEPGSEVTFTWDSLGQSIALEVLDADPPHHLALRGRPPNRAPQDQRVTVRPGPRGSVVEVVHTGFAAGDRGEDERAGTEAGWRGMLEVLRLYLERYRGRRRAGFAALGTAVTDLDAAYAWLADPSRWLSPSPPVGGEGDRYRLALGGDEVTGRVLVRAPPHQIVLSCREIDGAVSLRAFAADGRADHGPKIVGAQVWSWSRDPRALDRLRPELEAGIDRLVARLGGPAALA